MQEGLNRMNKQVKFMDCQFVKWYMVHSLGQKYPFCRKEGSSMYDELCPRVAGEECSGYKEKKDNV